MIDDLIRFSTPPSLFINYRRSNLWSTKQKLYIQYKNEKNNIRQVNTQQVSRKDYHRLQVLTDNNHWNNWELPTFRLNRQPTNNNTDFLLTSADPSLFAALLPFSLTSSKLVLYLYFITHYRYIFMTKYYFLYTS